MKITYKFWWRGCEDIVANIVIETDSAQLEFRLENRYIQYEVEGRKGPKKRRRLETFEEFRKRCKQHCETLAKEYD